MPLILSQNNLRKMWVMISFRKGGPRGGQPVADAALAGRAMIDRRVFPKRPHLVHQRQPITTSDRQRRQAVQRRRVGVQHIRLNLFNDFRQPSRQAPDNR